jgi:hypothetical protein
MDNNSHTLFIVNAAVGDEMAPNGEPMYETYDLSELGRMLTTGMDYEGIASLTIEQSGDVLDIEVTYHITTDGLVDVEAL